MPKLLKQVILGLAAIFVLIQFYRPERTNPPVNPDMTIQAKLRVPPDVDALIRRSCYDCHSHETKWPWYSNIAPAMWLVASDVEGGRKKLNLSEWTYQSFRAVGRLDQMAQEVHDNDMPLPPYLLMHPSARLTEEEKNLLYDWIDAERERLLDGDEEGEEH